MDFRIAILFKAFVLVECHQFFRMATSEVEHFFTFCLPTQSNLELPANSHLIHCRDFVPFSLLEQSFDNMSRGSSAQPRLRNPAVHGKCGWQEQGTCKDPKGNGNCPRAEIIEADKPHMNTCNYIFLPSTVQLPHSLRAARGMW